MSEGQQQAPSKKIDPASIFAGIFVLCLVVGIPVFIVRTCRAGSPIRDETRDFFGRIRKGETRAAYDALASARRSQLGQEQFESETQRPVFRGYEKLSVDATQSHDDQWGCTRGELTMGGKDWTYELYLVKEDGKWRAHTWAVDEPAAMDRLNKLDQCHQW